MANPFWDFSLVAYAAPGVAEACLEAQDSFGLDVNLVLYAAWLAELGQALTPEHLDGMNSATGEWRRRAVAPLRALRRDLASLADAHDLREQVKSLELAAEQQQQALMWRLYSETPSLPSGATLAENVALVFRAGKATESAAVACQSRLVSALSGVAEGSAQ